MQLHMTDSDYCDFYVWSPNDTHMERIYKDTEMWESSAEKARTFHKECVLPELLCKFFTRKKTLKPTVNQNTEQDNQVNSGQGYCVCGGDDDGRKMILCENENCKRQWYHIKCIKLKRVPKGHWYCNDCRSRKQ